MTNAILAIGAVLAIIGIAIEMVVIEPARPTADVVRKVTAGRD